MRHLGELIIGVLVIVVLPLAVIGGVTIAGTDLRLSSDRWRCAMVKPATKVGERAECVVYVDVRVARQAQQQPQGGAL